MDDERGDHSTADQSCVWLFGCKAARPCVLA